MKSTPNRDKLRNIDPMRANQIKICFPGLILIMPNNHAKVDAHQNDRQTNGLPQIQRVDYV